MSDPLRVPLTELRVDPGAYLETARTRRVLLTRRGRVVGELVPMDEAVPAPIKPLLGCGSDLVMPVAGTDLTEPADADWDAALREPSFSTHAPSCGFSRA